MLKNASAISVAKGKKIQNFAAADAEKEEVLKQAMGPSGNLRAPTFRIKNQYIIGFNPELYEDRIK